MNDPLNLKPFIRSVDDYPIPGIKFRDITSLLETPSAFATACDEMTALSKDFRQPLSSASKVAASSLPVPSPAA